LSIRRRLAGVVLTVLGLPLLTAALVPMRNTLSLPSLVLIFLLAVVLVALTGGIWPAVLAAVAGFLLLNWYFAPPIGTLTIAQRDHVIALGVFVAVAVLVSAMVEFAAASAARAARSEAEAQLVASLARQAPAEVGLPEVLRRIGAAFGLTCVRLEERGSSPEDRTGNADWTTLETYEQSDGDIPATDLVQRVVPVPDSATLRLVLVGPPLFAEDQRLLSRLAAAVGTAVTTRRLAEQAAAAERLAAADSLRTALLAAVGHDLRTPLAGIKAAVSTLRQPDVEWTAQERADLYATIEESTDLLIGLITNLLDLSRLEAGQVSVASEPVPVDAVIAAAARSVGSPALDWQVPEDLPPVLADAGLLERVLANVLGNAARYGSAAGSAAPPISVCAIRSVETGEIRIDVVDHGPGVPRSDVPRIFVPFQRLDDRGRGSGLGLGLAVALGFTQAMGGRIEARETPGGGLTMSIALPEAPVGALRRPEA
jgi:two-component system sensor histidine kinase KdpD